jgi:uncharacterized protein (DUF2062 family)
MILTLRRTLRYYTLKFFRLQGNPRSLAMGTAIGIFIAISPTIPLHTGIIIGVTLLMRVSTVAAIITAAVVCNPLTMIPLYYLCWLVGNFLLPGRLTWERIKDLLNIIAHESFMTTFHAMSSLSFDAILVMLTGGLVIGIPAAFVGYYYSLRFFIALQEKRRQKHLLD